MDEDATPARRLNDEDDEYDKLDLNLFPFHVPSPSP